jgi:hypothetical protein
LSTASLWSSSPTTVVPVTATPSSASFSSTSLLVLTTAKSGMTSAQRLDPSDARFLTRSAGRAKLTLTAQVTRTVLTIVRAANSSHPPSPNPNPVTTIATTITKDRPVFLTATSTLKPPQVTIVIMATIVTRKTVTSIQPSAAPTTSASARTSISQKHSKSFVESNSTHTTSSSGASTTITMRTTTTLVISSTRSTFSVSSVSSLPTLQFSPGGMVVFASEAQRTHFSILAALIGLIFVM